MAEAWRLDEDEEELKEVGRRHQRAILNPATDHSERNKPDLRSSGQGPLSSIKAAIKRTSRTSHHSEQQRERRRPEITIVSAEPLGPSSWFPGRNGVRQQGLVFPSSHSQPPWRASELVLAEPPSYEQVIKEISQAQVNPTSNNNVTRAANSRCITTSSTQTDFPEEIISNLPGINVKSNLYVLSECKSTQAVQIPQKPPRPSSSLLNSNPPQNEELLVVLEEQISQEKLNAVICPVPKPRSKGNLKPLAKDNQEEKSQLRSEKDIFSNHLVFSLADSLRDSHIVMDSMDIDKNHSSISSRIKSFETQENIETSGLIKKPEVSPRSLGPKPIISAKKPVVAPKPGSNRTSGEWEIWTENKQKTVSQEFASQSEEVGSNVVTKPELPKKPVIVKSNSNGLLNSGIKSALENSEGQRKFPIPAPRPLVPKKTVSFESSSFPVLPLKPISTVPMLPVVAQSNAVRCTSESFSSSAVASPGENISPAEGDLISFDDDVSSLNSVKALPEVTLSESDFINLSSKSESAKEQPVQQIIVRKPTVIRIPSKPAKALNDILESPPPLPTEKPIGNTSGIATGKSSNIRIIKKEPDQSSLTQPLKNDPILPPRPLEGKIIRARPSPPKAAPGRPPPPKSTKISSHVDSFPRSSSDMTLHKKPNTFGLGIKKTKSDVIKNHGLVLPPRPKPGHPLYNKYMLPVPHGIAKEDISSQSSGHLSCKDSANMQKITDSSIPRAIVLHNFIAEHIEDLELKSGETVFLLEKIDDEWYRGKCKNHTGIFPASFVKVIVDIPGGNNRKKEEFPPCNIVGPRCKARFEYIGDQKDELSFSEGEIITLKGYVNEEWAKGELRGISGIFPLNFVEVIEDLSETGEFRKSSRNKNSGPVTQLEGQAGEWCEALHDFPAETQDDLPFKKGDCILILEHLDSEWYRGRLNGKEGIFPAVFVHVCSEGLQSSQSGRGKKTKAKALYDFHAENIDELSFKVGDVIAELESVDEEWMRGELQGKSGIFPQNFVQILQL